MHFSAIWAWTEDSQLTTVPNTSHSRALTPISGLLVILRAERDGKNERGSEFAFCVLISSNSPDRQVCSSNSDGRARQFLSRGILRIAAETAPSRRAFGECPSIRHEEHQQRQARRPHHRTLSFCASPDPIPSILHYFPRQSPLSSILVEHCCDYTDHYGTRRI